jgi:gamma-glutamyltranspeptidase/glutathione hydrolase
MNYQLFAIPMIPLKNQRTRLLIVLIGIIYLVGCQVEEQTSDIVDWKASTEQYATSEQGMVSTAHPLATAAGVKMLEKGGNAADAAIASAFALSVVEPAMSGLGGRMQAIIRSNDGEIYGIDATTQAPMTYDSATAPQASYGYAVIGVPGVVAGLTKLANEHASLPLNILMGPAIEYAEKGFYQLPGQVELQNRVRHQVLEFEGTKQYFIKEGDTLLYGPEDLLVQKDLANTLRIISEKGSEGFYRGEIAEKIAEDMGKNGAAVDMQALADYEAKDATVLTGSYRGYDVHGLWMPSFGAITIEILQILDNLPMDSYSDAEWASAMYQAIKIAYEDRRNQGSLEDGQKLISPEYAKQLAERISIGAPMEANLDQLEQDFIAAWNENPGHTTHMSVADANGMVVSLTQSIGPIMGSRVVTPGLGFLYAATLGGYLGPMAPGARASSHISPMILTTAGQPFMVVGAAGGGRINSAIVQAICRVVDGNLNLYEALKAPRVHPSDEGILIEIHDSLAWNTEDLEFLKNKGFIINQQKEPFRFGRVHVVMQDNATWVGAADPDGEGSVAGPGIN